jgi:hypothetical protein
LIRAGRPDGDFIRAKSVYSYPNKDFAEFAWRTKKGMHLYKVEIDEADIVHIGSLDSFTAVEEAQHEQKLDAVKKYWTPLKNGRRVEILSTRARIVKTLKNDSDR